MGRRNAGRLAHAERHARRQHLGESTGSSEERSRGTPEQDRAREEGPPHAAIGQAGQRHAGHRKEQRESAAHENAELCIRERDLGLDGGQDDRDDHALPVIGRIDQEQQQDDVREVGPRGVAHSCAGRHEFQVSADEVLRHSLQLRVGTRHVSSRGDAGRVELDEALVLLGGRFPKPAQLAFVVSRRLRARLRGPATS